MIFRVRTAPAEPRPATAATEGDLREVRRRFFGIVTALGAELSVIRYQRSVKGVARRLKAWPLLRIRCSSAQTRTFCPLPLHEMGVEGGRRRTIKALKSCVEESKRWRVKAEKSNQTSNVQC